MLSEESYIILVREDCKVFKYEEIGVKGGRKLICGFSADRALRLIWSKR